MALIDLSEKFKEIRNSVEKVNFTDVRLTEKFKKEYELYLSKNRANGYSKVEWAGFSTKITTTTGKAIFITNFWFYIAAELSNYLDGLSQQKEIFKDIYKDTDLQEAAVALRDGVSDQEKNKIENYFSSKGYTNNDLECFLSFVSDYQSWGGGKTIDRNDYYVSPLLQAGNLLAETQSAVAEIAKQMSENPALKNSFKPIFIPKVQKSTETLLSNGSQGCSTLSKPFLLLAGISGTGKTRFVREQAKTSGQFAETYCLTSVRPDWHEPSDLLGYISRLAKDGQAEYITTDVLQFIAKAWRAITDSGLSVEVQDSQDLGERLVVTGKRDTLEQVLPYWLCLDEMNLAPVEQYFADYLSVLETREWHWTGDSFTYSSDALLKSTTIHELADKGKLRQALGFEAAEYDELWQLICQYGLSIPFNLMVAGTVNMDETTHGFSRKVIDRALSFEFGEFFPNNFNEFGDFGTQKSCNKRLSYPIWSHASKVDLANTFDADGLKTVAFLSAVNAVLKSTPFELAFRALNELLLAVASSQPQDDLTLKAVWDDFMMCKVLPRIEGDSDKLTTADGKALLSELNSVLEAELAPIWEADINNADNQRPDLYREKLEKGAMGEEKVLRIPCRSKAKLKWMSDRLASATFTSFWP